MSNDLLSSALDNQLRKQYSLNILFGEIDKNSNVQGFTQWCGPEKHQNDEDIKEPLICKKPLLLLPMPIP